MPAKPKLPAALKCNPYADVVAASRDGQTIFAAHAASSRLALWSHAGGIADVQVEHSIGDLAMLDANRIVGANSLSSHGQGAAAGVNVWGLDGKRIGGLTSKLTDSFHACAVSADGKWIAAASRPHRFGDFEQRPKKLKPAERSKLSIWAVDDLLDGKAGKREIEGVEPVGLAFVPGTSDVLHFTGGKLCVVPVSGSPKEIATKVSFERANYITVAEQGDLVCLSYGSGAALVTLAGKRLWESADYTLEHAAIMRDGESVIAAAGDVKKHYASDIAKKAEFPKAGMEKGYIGVFDVKTGKVRSIAPLKNTVTVRAMTLAHGTAVVLGQDGAAEIAAWPV